MGYRRAGIFFVLAIAVGLVALWTARNLIEERSKGSAAAEVETVMVVVARSDIAVGTALQPLQLDTVAWPSSHAPGTGFERTEQLADRVLRRAVTAGEPVLEPMLLPEGAAAGLSGVISSKRRAVSVKVDPVIGVAGFVHPGVRVDVLATLRRVDQKDRVPYSKVILQDVPVLAVDQKLEEGRSGEPELVSVVTLEVSPEHAEQLIYSSHEGRLQLAMRSPEDREVVTTSSVGVADLLPNRSPGRPAPRPSAKPRPGVEVLKGSTLSEKQF
jgi:pilus assembly protein CpaB